MTKRLAGLALAAAAFAAFALPAVPASAEICVIDEATIGLRVCV